MQLTSQADIYSVVMDVIRDAAAGRPVFITESLYASISKLLEALGINAEQYSGELPPNAILLRKAGNFVEVVTYESGAVSGRPVRIPLSKFVSVLRAIARQRRGGGEKVTLWRLEVPPELLEAIKGSEGGNISGGSDGGGR